MCKELNVECDRNLLKLWVGRWFDFNVIVLKVFGNVRFSVILVDEVYLRVIVREIRFLFFNFLIEWICFCIDLGFDKWFLWWGLILCFDWFIINYVVNSLVLCKSNILGIFLLFCLWENFGCLWLVSWVMEGKWFWNFILVFILCGKFVVFCERFLFVISVFYKNNVVYF